MIMVQVHLSAVAGVKISDTRESCKEGREIKGPPSGAERRRRAWGHVQGRVRAEKVSVQRTPWSASPG